MNTSQSPPSLPVTVELAPLPRTQVGPFLILGVDKDATKEDIEAGWAQRFIWARRNQIPIPLEDINWARDTLGDSAPPSPGRCRRPEHRHRHGHAAATAARSARQIGLQTDRRREEPGRLSAALSGAVPGRDSPGDHGPEPARRHPGGAAAARKNGWRTARSVGRYSVVSHAPGVFSPQANSAVQLQHYSA